MYEVIITYKDGRVVTHKSNMDLGSLEFVTTEMMSYDDSIAKIEIIEP